MSLTRLCILLVSLIIVSPAFVYSQGRADNQSLDDRLPSLKEFVDHGLALRYIDDALAKARAYKSSVIFIIKMKNSNDISLARMRTKNVRNYVRFRRFENFEVTVDLIASEDDRIDIHVRGEPLYSLPIKKDDKLKFVGY